MGLTSEQRQERTNRGQCIYCSNNAELDKNKCSICTAKSNEATKRSQAKMKVRVFEHYGNKCICCGDDYEPHLQLDHINDDGYMQRQFSNDSSGTASYRLAIRLGYPTDLQLLCANCHVCKTKKVACRHG